MRRVSVSFVVVLLGWLVACGGAATLDLQRSTLSVDRNTGLVADGKDAAVASVRVVGDDGKPMAGVAVTLSVDGTGGTVTPAQLTTDANGQGQAKVTSTRAEVKTLSAAVQTQSQSARLSSVQITFSAGAPDPATSTLTVPARAHTGETLPITVRILDAQGNPCAGQQVSLSASGSGNTLSPSFGVTGADGTLAASFSSTQAEGKVITATLSGFSLTANAVVAAPAWASQGPGGGDVKLFALDPSNSAVAYAASSTGGLFKTVDGGATWFPIDDGLNDFEFTQLVIDPLHPSRIFAATTYRVFRSTDGGASWGMLGASPSGFPSGAIALDPTQPNVIYAASYPNKVLKSVDGGDTWTGAQDTLDGDANALAVDPHAPGVVYAATATDVFKSTDAGVHWVAVNNGFTLGTTVFDGLVLAPTTPATLFAYGQGSGVWRSVDGGANWTLITALDKYPAAMVVDPLNPSTVWEIDGAAHLQRSVDAGANWAQVTSPASVVVGVGLSPKDPDLVFSSAWKKGIFKSTNQGANWTASSQGLLSAEVDSLWVDPGAHATVIACGSGVDVIGSTDSGANWAPFGTGLPSGVEQKVIGDPANPGTYLMINDQGGYFSNGGTWTQLGSGLPTNPSLDQIVAGPTELYVHGAGHGVYRLPVGTSTWLAANNGLSGVGITGLAIDPTDDNRVYASTNMGFYETTDAGASWNRVGAATLDAVLEAVAVSPADPATLYAGDAIGAVYRSTDAGATWTKVRQETSYQKVTALAVDATDAHIVYVATEGEGLWKSIDGGATWTAKDSGLWFPTVKAIAIDPVSNGTIYLATGAGVFKSTTAAE